MARRTSIGIWQKWTRLRYADAGVAAVEFAIIGPVFVLILIGMMQYGVLLYKIIDIRFQANQFARAVAAQAIDIKDVAAMCANRFHEVGYTCAGVEDTKSYTVSFAYDTAPISMRLFPLPESVSYSAYQVKYAVQ